MKKNQLIFLICIFVSVGMFWSDIQPSVLAAQAEQAKEGNILFRLAFVALVGNEGNRKLVDIPGDAQLKTGDQFKMMVELKKTCFVYVIYRGSEGEVQLLFPYNLKQFLNEYKPSEKYYIPRGDLWFALDEKVGRETFYVMASTKRLTELEALITAYESSDSKKKPELANKVLSEIRKIRLQHKTFTAAAERPVQIGGNVRGIAKDPNTPYRDIDALAVEVSAIDFYSRTYTIEHD